MSKVSCEIIKDLLPLYYDEVCSSESKKLLEEHLAKCSSCKTELDRIRVDIKMPKETVEKNSSDGKVIKNIADFWNRSKVKAFAKGVIGATVLFTVLFLGYIGLFRWAVISVPTDVVEITDVCELADGRIAYRVELTDDYDLTYLKFDLDEDGNSYVMSYRPIIKTKAKDDTRYNTNYENMYYLIDYKENNAYQKTYGDGIETKALYYGTPKDNILIWEKGMD